MWRWLGTGALTCASLLPPSPVGLMPSVVDSLVLIVQPQMGLGLDTVSPAKLEAALVLALELSGRFTVVAALSRDSVVEELRSRGQEPTAVAVAQRLGCGRMLFARADRLQHLVRVEVVFRFGENFAQEQRGRGFALIRYAHRTGGTLLLDPALLEAAQRAIAVAVGDSMLYAAQEGPFCVVPAPLLVVGGLEYRDTGELRRWDWFARKVVTSYDAVLQLIDTLRRHPGYVVCDIDSRDTLFARAGLMEPENYRPPSPVELRLLRAAEVDYYVWGTIERVPEGARIRLQLARLQGDARNAWLEPVREVQGSVAEDSVALFRKRLRQLGGELLWAAP